MITHAYTKPLLFSCAGGLIAVSKHSKLIKDLNGAGRRNPLAGIGFVIGSLSMVGVPLFAGFASKVYLATSASEHGYALLIALAVSSFLNALYYLPVVFRIYAKETDSEETKENVEFGFGYKLSICCFVILNFVLGIGGMYVMYLLNSGVQLL